MKKPLLVFDCFGVVVEEVAYIWLARHMSRAESLEIINTTFVAVDEGRITSADCFKILEERSGIPASEIEQEWNEIGELKQDTFNFIKNNQDKYYFALLSNAGVNYITPLLEKYELNSLFSKIYISAALHIAKPSKEIFLHVLKTINVPYTVAIMIDDNPVNIKAAESVGMGGVVFTNMAQAEIEIANIIKDLS